MPLRPHFILLLLWALASAPALWAQQMAEGEMDAETAKAIIEAHNKGMSSFATQQWAEATDQLSKVVALIENYPDKKASDNAKNRLQNVYFTLGAAWFNVPEHTASVKAFEKFISEFPNHARVMDAKLAIAKASFATKDYEKAVALFAEMEKYPSLRDQALSIQAQCFKELGRRDEMSKALSRLIEKGIQSTTQASGGLMLAQAWFEQGKRAEALGVVKQLHERKQFVENIIALNSLIVALGDGAAENADFEQASRIYLMVMIPAEVRSFQTQRIQALERRLAANEAAAKAVAQADPQRAAAYIAQNTEFTPVLEQARALLAEFEKLPDYMPGLMLRNARCWYGRDKKWETIVVAERLLASYPEAKSECESAQFMSLIAHADLMQAKPCHLLCEQYLKTYPDGPNAGTVAYVQGAVAMQAGDLRTTATVFGTRIGSHPDGSYAEQMHLMLGAAHFSLGELDLALKAYQDYLTKFPKGDGVEEARYRSAIIPVFQGKYEAGWKALEAFLQFYPKSGFAEDAKYRLMVCKYAANLYDAVLADAAKFALEHAEGRMQAEVLSLKGDCLAATLKDAEAADAYRLAAEKAPTDEVLSYAQTEASQLLSKLGRTAELIEMWQTFIKTHPEHSNVVSGIFWIGKAKTKEYKIDEAKAITVEQLKRCIADHKNESVELLVQQLAQFCWKRPRVKPVPEPVAVVLEKEGKPVQPAPEPPPLPPWDALAELEKVVEPLTALATSSATARARLDFGRVELLRLLRKETEADEKLRGITVTAVDALSPQLLALSGDYLLQHGLQEEALKCFSYLKENYLKSGWLDYAYYGLGSMELGKGNTAEALLLFSKAVDEFAGIKLKDSTMGKARCLLELARYDEARRLFESVAGSREWRGEATAEALFRLGEVEERQKHLPEAVAHYQRVFVAYQKYLPWVEQAYLRAAHCFDQLGKRAEAVKHLQEVARHEKISAATKEAARKLLLQWGGAAS